MIDRTFAHLPGIRRKGEIRLWNTHVVSWKQMISHTTTHPHFTRKVWTRSRQEIIRCQDALDQKDFEFLAVQIPEEYHWRMIPDMWGNILFFDVEMSGLDISSDYITSIATYDGHTPRYFVIGKNLKQFPDYLRNFSAICTFDGERADIPFLQKKFENQIEIPPIHFDLFILSRRLQLKGGLKEIEAMYNLSRSYLEGITGKSAIILWDRFQKTQDPRYLNTLIAYNQADVMFLPYLLQEFYNALKKKVGLPCKLLTNDVEPFEWSFKPDLEVMKEISEQLKVQRIE